MFIQTFRVALGELHNPGFNYIIEKGTSGYSEPPNFFLYVNVYMIWLLFLIETYFLQIMMLNFMVAVMMSTYDNVVGGGLQEIIGYKYKAELNFETLLTLSKFKNLQEYRCIVISNAREQMKNDEQEMIQNFFSVLKDKFKRAYEQGRNTHTEIEKNLRKIETNNNSIINRISNHQQKILLITKKQYE